MAAFVYRVSKCPYTLNLLMEEFQANFCFYQSQFHLCLSFKNSILWSRICSCSKKADSPTGESIIVTISCSVTTEIQYISKKKNNNSHTNDLQQAKCFANVRKYFITFMCYCYEDCCYLFLNDSRRGKELTIIIIYLCSITIHLPQNPEFELNELRYKGRCSIKIC